MYCFVIEEGAEKVGIVLRWHSSEHLVLDALGHLGLVRSLNVSVFCSSAAEVGHIANCRLRGCQPSV